MLNDRLQSNLVILQRYTLEDIAELFAAIHESIERVYPWLPWCHPNYTIAETEQWLKTRPQLWNEKQEFAFSIRDRQGTIVGGCGLRIISANWSANLGYWLRTGYTGKGYATAATMMLAEFGIKQLQLKRIEIVISVQNTSSRAVAERAGARLEGVSRNLLEIHGKAHDAVIYSFIPQDFSSNSHWSN